MKKILILLILLIGSSVFAVNHTVGTGGTFTTIAQVNAHTFAPGDSILFKRGETFAGTILISQAGTLANNIVLGAYGTGLKPVITSFTTITGWNNTGGGIYSKVVSCESALTMLLINNIQYAKGRYPNTGWLYYDSHVGTTALTDSALPTSPIYTGGDAIIRKNLFTINKNPITNHTAQTLTITNTGVLTNGWGYFINNNLNTLDQYGEWYYNTSTSTLYVYFGAIDPTTRTTQIPVSNYGVTIADETHYLTITNLNLIGYISRGISLYHNDFITVKDCDISYCGSSGIRVYVCDNVTILRTSTNYCNDWGIFAGGFVNTLLVQGCNILNTETISGQGQQTNMSGVGLYAFQGNNIILENNTITNSGYHGISFGGNNQIVRNNVIDNYGRITTDCGGIYYGERANYTSMSVVGNIILNGFGNTDGSPSAGTNAACHGIYIDYGTTGGVTITGNTTANCLDGFGIFNNASPNLIIRNNTAYNCDAGIGMQGNQDIALPQAITGLVINGNKFIAKESTQLSFWGRLDLGHTWPSIGTLDSNYYARPISDATHINALIYDWYGVPPVSLATFKGYTTQDAHSYGSYKIITATSELRFEYNATAISKTVSLGAGFVDVAGTTYNGSITLQPYTSVVLMPYAITNNNNSGGVIKSYGKVVKF